MNEIVDLTCSNPAATIGSMTETSFSEEFQPHLDPSFWNGHMFTDGDPRLPELSPISLRGYYHGITTLEESLPQMQVLWPLHTYHEGSTFKAGDHSPGTIVLYKQHALYPLEMVKKQVPRIDEPEPALNLNFGSNEGYPRILQEFGLQYRCSVDWAVVVESRRGAGMIAFSGGAVVRRSEAVVELGGGRAIEPTIHVGETQHLRDGKANEALIKTSLLHVCGYGKIKRARKPAKYLLGSLIPKPV